MRATMNHRYLQYLDSGNSTNFTSPGSSSSAGPSAVPTGGPPKSNAFSPAVVAVIGVLAGAFLIVSYYRIFLRYCNRHHISFWGSRSDNRNGGPSTIVLMEEHTWPPDAVGLDESLIKRIPTCKYKPEDGLVDGTECSVCLGDFEAGEELRILPKCNHPFHVPCIDTWLATSSTCPLCRVNIVLAAGVPYSLMPPVEREGPAGTRGPTMALVPEVSRPLIHHEIEVLQQEPHQQQQGHPGQEFLEAGQLSGPSSSRASSRGSFTCAPDVDRTPDTRASDASLTHHMRHLSLETDSSTTTREIHVITDTEPPIPRPAPDISVSKRRLYRHRRSSDPKGKLPQTKRFARIMGSSSTLSSRSTAGSSSLNQVVVELLAQEIFQNNVSSSGSQTVTESTIVETSVRSSRRPARQDNASFEVMWSIHEQENPLMEPSTSFHNRDSSSEMMMMEEDSSFQLSSHSDSDSEDGTRLSRSNSLKRSSTKYDPWPSKRHSLRDSVARLSKRCGSVNLRQKTEKVHTSEPVFEIFDF